MKVLLVTFGCKANQYDTERFRQELEARGAQVVDDIEEADACVVNTCTVTHQADAAARKQIRRLVRQRPGLQVIVAGCSAALRPQDYEEMPEVSAVVGGQDPQAVVGAVVPPTEALARVDEEPIGASLLERNDRGTRAWMKIQDGCDRRCSFCATRLARGTSRSRPPADLVAELRQLARHHREVVLTGIHIGHYGLDLAPRGARRKVEAFGLSSLVALLLEEVDGVRLRLGSVEATEIDDGLLDLLATSGGRLVPHLHVPMQAGSDRVLRSMRRWHSREQYRGRMLEIVDRLPYLGLGADVIVGFPGEEDEDFQQTEALVAELPFTYLHVFPYSTREETAAAALDDCVDPQVKAERSRALRELALAKGAAYRHSRVGQGAEIVIEEADHGITEDYLRVRLVGDPSTRTGELVYAPLEMDADGELVARV